MRTQYLAVILALCAGCSDDLVPSSPGHGEVNPDDAVADPHANEGRLVISPQQLSAVVVDGVTVIQPYAATLVRKDGSEVDVTTQTQFALDPRFGAFSGETLTLTGGGAGPTTISGSTAGVAATATVTVFVQSHRREGVSAEVAAMFARAKPGACSPQIAYPSDDLTVPANLGELDVHWRDDRNDVFAVSVQNRYVDLTIYTMGRDVAYSYWTAVDRAAWAPFAATKQPMTLAITGLSTAAPDVRCESPRQTINITNEDALGAVYYWSTSADLGQDILRYDFATPELEPAPLFDGAPRPAACIGCHALSRDGSKIALTLDSATGAGTVLDLTDMRPMMPVGNAAPLWSAAAFSADGDKLLSVRDGVMSLRTTDGGAVLATVPSNPGKLATNPEFSPDGTLLASVEINDDGYGVDWDFRSASVLVRQFDDATNTFGEADILMPFTLTGGGGGIQSYYPSFSPDSKWLVVTRSPSSSSFSNTNATIWVIRVDQSVPPIEITGVTGLTDSAARWMPYESTVGDRGEPVFFLSFSSSRPFGTRIADGGRPQIWLTPFFPERATAREVATASAFRAPFQDANNDNHTAQWATGIPR